jgi:hypothetical protein
MSFLTLPPEVNSTLIHSGVGSAPMLAAASAWDGLASELASAASSFSSMTSGLTNAAWQGAAAQAMMAAAAPYAGWLSTAADHAAGAAQQARSVASVFEAAQAATVHPLAVAANRNSLVQLAVSNIFGQNAPAIAATECEYEQMWAQDVDAMVGYHAGASQAAASLTAAKFTGVAPIARNLAKLFARLPRALRRLEKYDEGISGRIGQQAEGQLGKFIGDVEHIVEKINQAFHRDPIPTNEKETLQLFEQRIRQLGGELPRVPGIQLPFFNPGQKIPLPTGFPVPPR